MSITSFSFLCCLVAVILIYYCIPKRVHWVFLLLVSLSYFATTGYPILLIYPVVTTLVAYFGGMYLYKVKGPDKKKLVLSLVIFLSIGILGVLKYTNFFVYTRNAFSTRLFPESTLIPGIHFLVPLGISFYTLSLLGYVIDIYYELEIPEQNPFKLLLYGVYFPVMNSGPILRFKDMKAEFFKPHVLQFEMLTKGMQRILWGFMKKLVIAERLAILVNTVFDHNTDYGSLVLFLAAICFVIQLYADFSGYMDIVIGISQLFGIKIPENFNTPFFATSVAEFWRRWHMTLGAWLKDYLFYPLLRTPLFLSLPTKLKGKVGKKAAKQSTVFSGMFLLWFTVGIWHGGAWKYIIGSGLIHWFYIVMEEALEPVWKKMRVLLHINLEARGYLAFQRIRTLCLFSIAFIFFRAQSLSQGLAYIRRMVTTLQLQELVDGTVFRLGLEPIELVIAVVSFIALYLVSRVQYRGIDVRDKIAELSLPLRWAIYYGLLFYVILLGYYGPGYSAAEFIYQAF